MPRQRPRQPYVRAAIVLAAALAIPAAAGAGPPAGRIFRSADGGVRLRPPAEARISREPTRTIFTQSGWRTMRPDAMRSPDTPDPGSTIVTLSIGGRGDHRSGDVSLQFGASRAPQARRTCLALPNDGAMGPSDHVRIGRLSWAHRSYGDAGMNQSIALDEYRRLDRGTCWAVALLTFSSAEDANGRINSKFKYPQAVKTG